MVTYCISELLVSADDQLQETALQQHNSELTFELKNKGAVASAPNLKELSAHKINQEVFFIGKYRPVRELWLQQRGYLEKGSVEGLSPLEEA
ncbi:hypothetical protein BSKO_06841 [Bryopsis sp. KO-2023]|nr:hypothetical protein BSKO_06841 [Bryopsis sp. KO-2023]